MLRVGQPQGVRSEARRATGAPVEISSAVCDSGRLLREVLGRTGMPVRLRWEGSPVEVLGRVAEHTGVLVERLQSNERVRQVSGARRLALLVWEQLGRRRVEMSAHKLSTVTVVHKTRSIDSLKVLRKGNLAWESVTIEQLAEQGKGEAYIAAATASVPEWSMAAQPGRVRPTCAMPGGTSRTATGEAA